MNVPVKNQMLYNKRTPFGDHFRVSFCPLVDIFISFSLFYYIYSHHHHHHHFVPPFDDEEGLRTVFARGVCGSFPLSFSLFSLLLKRARAFEGARREKKSLSINFFRKKR